MLILGSRNNQRTSLLIKQYKRLIENGIDYSQIMVIVLNAYKKERFIQEAGLVNTKSIYTPYGICYNAFLDNIEFIKSLSKKTSNKPINLCGLDVSQYIFKQCIKEADFKDYISKINLLHQLFRRYSLIVQNNLSTKEILEKSNILNESFALEAQKVINDYKIKTIEYNCYDYLRQMAIFQGIYKETGYYDNIKYLLVDDADELPYTMWQFIKYLVPKITEYTIFSDKNGVTRCGYLCAYKSGTEDFIKEFKPKIIKLEDKTPFSDLAETLFNNIRNGKKTNTGGIKIYQEIKRLDMIEKLIKQIKELISKGINPSDIVIITPITDEILIKTLRDNSEIKFQILSGSEKLADIKEIKHILIILKLANSITVKDYELKSILNELLKIPVKRCFSIINDYEKNSVLSKENFTNSEYQDKYIKLYSSINALKKNKLKLYKQIEVIYENIIKEFSTAIDNQKIDFLIKEAKNFESAFEDGNNNIISDFIKQEENSIISENPINSFKYKENSIITASPQKIADYSIQTKYQLWLDISNSEWLKQDTGTLYNAWVLNRDWDKKTYTFEDNLKLTLDKTARLVRKTLKLCTKEVIFFSSIYDNTGNENYSGLNEYIESSQREKKKEIKIIPRKDQLPVLKYKGGKMAVMAVPGAGKTTILLMLIIKLLSEGIAGENIYVLTYMESAAKNFKERLKLCLNETFAIPNISTIHGLALRIIKENGNYNKIGLDENFEIIDDITREKYIKELFYKLKTDEDKYENYLKCISIVKLNEIGQEFNSPHKEINDFYKFYKEYNKILKTNNLIDYDDMLRYALKILNENPQILNYYQNIFKYIIEDEAQDSSEIQQKLLTLLSSKHQNLIRCGDINQAITTTFTNSDIKSFKSFLKNNTVEMTTSQRCSKPIYSLANKLIEVSCGNEESKNAFYKIKMQGNDNNPKNNTNPSFNIFENEKDEKLFILNKITEIQKNNPESSIAVLLRLNAQVNEYNEYLNSKGIKTTIRTDCLSQKGIYKIILAVLKIIQNPFNNEYIKDLANIYNENNITKINETIINSITSKKEPFINQNIDEAEDEGLIQLYWDVDYWLNNSVEAADITALKIGIYYSKTTIDKSNTYIISSFIKKLKNENESDEEIIKKLEYAAQKPLSAYKFFDDEKNTQSNYSVKIMTMHKSKGDEFDYVFIPQLTEDNYPLSEKNVKLKTGSHFIQTVKNSLTKDGIKTPEELKKEQLEENLRLLYVGITRAKQELFLSAAKYYKTRKKVIISDILINLCNNKY